MKNFNIEFKRYMFWKVSYRGKVYLLYDNVQKKYFVSLCYFNKLSDKFEIICN